MKSKSVSIVTFSFSQTLEILVMQKTRSLIVISNIWIMCVFVISFSHQTATAGIVVAPFIIGVGVMCCEREKQLKNWQFVIKGRGTTIIFFDRINKSEINTNFMSFCWGLEENKGPGG